MFDIFFYELRSLLFLLGTFHQAFTPMSLHEQRDARVKGESVQEEIIIMQESRQYSDRLIYTSGFSPKRETFST